MANREFVSFNQNMDDAKKEIYELIKKGYIVIDSYGDDYDMGNVYEYSLGEDREEVIKRHDEHIERCEEGRKLRKRLFCKED